MNVGAHERVEKVDTLLDGDAARSKILIFGLHSIPANTTPVPLKNRCLGGFSLIRCFFAAHVGGKTKCGVCAAKNSIFSLSTV